MKKQLLIAVVMVCCANSLSGMLFDKDGKPACSKITSSLAKSLREEVKRLILVTYADKQLLEKVELEDNTMWQSAPQQRLHKCKMETLMWSEWESLAYHEALHDLKFHKLVTEYNFNNM